MRAGGVASHLLTNAVPRSLVHHPLPYAEHFVSAMRLLPYDPPTPSPTPHPPTPRVPRSQRGGEVIEPLVSEQWFVVMEPLARPALAAVADGTIKIVPERFEKVYNFWLENIKVGFFEGFNAE